MSDELQTTDRTVSIKKRKPKKLPEDVLIVESSLENVKDEIVKTENVNTEIVKPEKIILTEDLGKKFEMGICMLYVIWYRI